MTHSRKPAPCFQLGSTEIERETAAIGKAIAALDGQPRKVTRRRTGGKPGPKPRSQAATAETRRYGNGYAGYSLREGRELIRSSLSLSLVIGTVIFFTALVAGCDTGTTTSTQASAAQKRLNARIALAYESQPGFKTRWCREANQAGNQVPQAAVKSPETGFLARRFGSWAATRIRFSFGNAGRLLGKYRKDTI